MIRRTDSTKSYRMRVEGVLHDPVIYCKNRMRVRGVWKWLNPRYVKVVEHKHPGSKKKIRVKAQRKRLIGAGAS